MRFKSALNIIFVILSFSAQGQNFYRSYGNSDDEVGKSVVETKDSSFFIFGTSSSFVNGTSNFYLLKIDSTGNFNWSKSFGGDGIEQGNAITMKPNGHYLLTGYSNSYGNGGYDILNIEIDSLGNEIWLKNHGGSDWDYAYDNFSLSDGKSFIAGSSFSIGNGNQDGFLMLLDDNGDSLWMKSYGYSDEDVLRKVISTSSGDIVAIGYTTLSNGDKEIYVVKTQPDGDSIWTKKYGTASDDEGFSLVEKPNGNYLMVGYTKGMGAGGRESYYFETDTSGAVLWTQNIGGVLEDEFRDVCLKTNTNRFFTAATTQSYGNGGNEAKGYLLYYPGGYYLYSNNYGTSMEEELNAVLYTNNKRCLMVGSTNSPYGNNNVLAVLSDTLFPSQLTMVNYIDVTSVMENETASFTFYPNPASDKIHFSENDHNAIMISDLTGKIHFQNTLTGTELDISHLTSGIYLIHLQNRAGQTTRIKLVVAR